MLQDNNDKDNTNFQVKENTKWLIYSDGVKSTDGNGEIDADGGSALMPLKLKWGQTLPFVLLLNIHFLNYYVPLHDYAREPPFNYFD